MSPIIDPETLAKALAGHREDPTWPNTCVCEPEVADFRSEGRYARHVAEQIADLAQTPAQFVAGLAEDEALVRHVALLASGVPQTDRDLQRANLHIRALAAALAEREA